MPIELFYQFNLITNKIIPHQHQMFPCTDLKLFEKDRNEAIFYTSFDVKHWQINIIPGEIFVRNDLTIDAIDFTNISMVIDTCTPREWPILLHNRKIYRVARSAYRICFGFSTYRSVLVSIPNRRDEVRTGKHSVS